MDLETIKPFIGLGDLRFGMEREEVRLLLGNIYKAFSREDRISLDVDYYVNTGLQLNYDANDELEFIEALIPANPCYRGLSFIGRSSEDAIRDIVGMGFFVTSDDVGYFFYELGFAFYAPHEKVEAISIFRKGYYDE